MEFKVYEIPNNVENAVYILFNNEEVVYVGQTKSGLRRLLNHSNKIFNKYAFIETDNLDYWEDYYIMQYQPKYNNTYNHLRLSVESAYYQLRAKIKKYINIFEFTDYIRNKNIEISNFKNKATITKEDFKKIKKFLEEEYGVS